MSPLLNKLNSPAADNTLSLIGNGFNPSRSKPAFGYVDPTANLDPRASRLQRTYSVDSDPKVRIVDFNKSPYPSYLPSESTLDELDLRAPKNTKAGAKGSVVSQIYKSKSGRRYKDLGPAEGRY